MGLLAARFGVDKKENALVEFARVIVGTLHHLTYEAKAWLNAEEHRFRQWREVPVDDPQVQHVTKVAVEYISNMNDSIYPYELQEVVHANAEVTLTGEAVKFNLLLKCKLGNLEEKYKVDLHKIDEGVFDLDDIEQVPLANQNSGEIESLFAVDEHNKKKNALVEFARLVAGTLHHLTLVILEAGEKKLYQAKVWLTAVPVDDPEVQHVAEHVIKIFNQRLNVVLYYKLQEVVHANVEVTGEAVKFHLILKLKLADKMEKKYKVEVHKNHEGALHLHHFEKHLD